MKRNEHVNRREFLGSAGAATLAVPTIVSATAFGRPDRPAPSDRITLGFIGIGTQNRSHLNHHAGRKDTQVLAVCEVDPTRRDNARQIVEERYARDDRGGKGIDAYVDYRELIARPDIDAVVIGTPDHWHAIPCIEACKAKKDIYCEKPLTLTIHEAKTLIDCVRKYDRVFQTGSQQRSSDEFRKAVEYVRSGRIGKILEVYASVGGPSKWCDLPEEPMEPGLDWDRWLGPAPKRPYNSTLSPRGVHKHFPLWRSYIEYSGGGMTDWGAHHFDIAQWGLGRDHSGPVEILPPDDLRKGQGVTFIYDDGIKLIHGGPGGVCFVGTNGVILVNRGRLEAIPNKLFDEPLKDSDFHLPEKRGSHHDDWVACIKTREKPICDVEIGARSVTVCHLGNLAYWHGRKLKWDPHNWEFPGDSEANGWRTREYREPYTLPTF